MIEYEECPKIVFCGWFEHFFEEITFGTRTVKIHKKSDIQSLEFGIRIWGKEEGDRNTKEIVDIRKIAGAINTHKQSLSWYWIYLG